MTLNKVNSKQGKCIRKPLNVSKSKINAIRNDFSGNSGETQSFVAYYRVSTQRQGHSGLGLEAQRNSVLSFIGKRSLIGEYKDIESGKNDHRPELLKAIEKSKETNSILVIAKLDRLSRNLNFITLLQSEKVKFVCCDLPDANELTIHIFGALAQWERKRISERTKDALSQLKKRGVKLGTSGNFSNETRKKGSLKMIEKAHLNSNNIKASKLISLLSENGKTLREIAIELNESGFKTSRGYNFGPEQVRRLSKTLPNLL